MVSILPWKSLILSNFLNSGNEIIITDDFIIEPFKSSDVIYTFNNNIEILRKYPNQILVTFDRGELIRKELSLGLPLCSKQLISKNRTEIIRDLLNLDKPLLSNKLNRLKNEAKNRIAYQDDFLEKYIRNIIKQAYTLLKKKGQTKEYRNNKVKRLNDIKEVSFSVLELLLKNKCSKSYDINNFIDNNSIIFSQTFIHLWRIVDWVIKGGAENAKKGIKGDSFDIKYVLISCFFDGILTKERWLDECRFDTLSMY